MPVVCGAVIFSLIFAEIQNNKKNFKKFQKLYAKLLTTAFDVCYIHCTNNTVHCCLA